MRRYSSILLHVLQRNSRKALKTKDPNCKTTTAGGQIISSLFYCYFSIGIKESRSYVLQKQKTSSKHFFFFHCLMATEIYTRHPVELVKVSQKKLIHYLTRDTLTVYAIRQRQQTETYAQHSTIYLMLRTSLLVV